MDKSIYTARQKRFCALIRQARKDAGMTQQELADALGRPQSFVAKIENGERRVDVVELLELAEAIKFNPLIFLEKMAIP